METKSKEHLQQSSTSLSTNQSLSSQISLVVFGVIIVVGAYLAFNDESKTHDGSKDKNSKPNSQISAQIGDNNQAEWTQKVEAKERKLQKVKETIQSLKAQIQKCNSSSAAMYFRELSSREAEYRILEQDVYFMHQQTKK